MIEKGSIVRLRAPKHKDTLENEWFCRLWEALTPMVYMGAHGVFHGFGMIMTPDSEVKTIWRDYLTNQMRRGYYNARKG